MPARSVRHFRERLAAFGFEPRSLRVAELAVDFNAVIERPRLTLILLNRVSSFPVDPEPSPGNTRPPASMRTHLRPRPASQRPR